MNLTKYNSIVLIISGIAFLSVMPMMMMFPNSWGWEPRQPEYEQMIMGVYAVLGIFLLIASRDPEKHLSLIWFTAISTLVHAVIMTVQALNDPLDRANLMGDIPALYLVFLLLALTTPRRLT